MEALIAKSIILIINIIAIWLIILVNIHKPKKGVVFLFTVMVVLMLIWINFAYLARITPPDYGLFFIRLAWAITPFFFIFIYLFIKNFLREEREKYSLFQKFLIIIGIIYIPITLWTPLIIKNIWFNQYNILTIIYGKGIWMFFGTIFLLTILSFYILIRAYIENLSIKIKTKIGYLLIGLSFFFLMNSIFNIILPVFFRVFHLYEFGDYSTIVFLSFITYAIVKHQLFEIKVVLTSLLVGLITILLAVDLFVFTHDLYLQIFKGLALMIFLFFGRLLIKSVLREIKQKEILEQKVQERTKELKGAKDIAEKRAAELERWYKITVGRELRMAELKKEIKQLEEKLKKK